MADNIDQKKLQQQLDELNQLERKLGRKLTSSTSEVAKDVGKLATALSDARRAFSELDDSATSLYEKIRGITSELGDQDNTVPKIRQAYRSLAKDAEALKMDELEISRLSDKELISLQKRVAKQGEVIRAATEELKLRSEVSDKVNKVLEEIEREGLENDEKIEYLRSELALMGLLSDEEQAILLAKYDENNLAQLLLDKTQKRLDLEREIADKVKSFTTLTKIAKSIPGLAGFSSIFEDASKSAEKAAREGKSLGEIKTEGFKSIGKSLFGAAAMIGVLQKGFKAILSILFTIDKQSTELGKSLGVSKEESYALRENFQDIADSYLSIADADLTVTTKNLLEARNELAKISGVQAGFTEDELVSQTRLVKNVGIQAESAARLAQLTRLQGKSSEDALDSTIKSTVQLKLQNGIVIDSREVLEDVAKINGQLAANYENNVELLGQAVVKARSLGLTLEQAANASKSLLDFESSISSELEAELLTGRSLNLERARALALQGKSAEAAEELSKNFGSLEEFTNLNVIAQNALAKSVGLTTDELANTLVQQKNLESLSAATRDRVKERVAELIKAGEQDKANALQNQAANEEAAEAALLRLDTEQKFAEAVEKAKDLFVGLIDSLPKLKLMLSGIAAIMAAIAASVVIASGGTALIGAGVAAAAAGLGTNYVLGKAFEESDGTKNESVKEETLGGNIQVEDFKITTHPKDTFVMAGGTKLGTGSEKTERLLERIVAAIEKGGDVYLDTNKVGTALVMGSHKM